jgi:uncharacterized membrane protein HdeD (DUF308 family)
MKKGYQHLFVPCTCRLDYFAGRNSWFPDSAGFSKSFTIALEVFMKSIYYSDSPGKSSTRIIFLGCLYLVFGVAALAFTPAATFFSVMTLGVILACIGIAEIVYGVVGRKRGQLWPHLAFGCLALICGGLVMINPIGNTLGLTLTVGFLLIASGLAKIVGSLAERSTGWGWYAANGIFSIVLGGLVLATFPYSAFWTIGTFVGIDLLLAGSMLIGLGMHAKRTKNELVGEVYSTLNPEPLDQRRPPEEHAPLH